MRMTPYLYFKGACEDALTFYAACGLGKVVDLRRYAGSPMEGRDGGAWRDKVIHSLFEGDGIRFYASDGPDFGADERQRPDDRAGRRRRRGRAVSIA